MWNKSNGTMRPLDDKQVKRISLNWKFLVERIQWDRLLAELYAHNCITEIQFGFINEHPEKVRNEHFLKLLSCKSIAEFNKFMSCLANTGQRHLVALLTTDSGLSLNYLLTRG